MIAPVIASVLALAQGQSPQADGTMDPSWTRAPQPGSSYPAFANFINQRARVTLECRVSRPGPPEDCEVIWSSPAGLGFEPLALSAAQTGILSPRLVDWKPVPHAKLRFSFNFALQGRGLYSGPEPSAEAITLARQLVRSKAAGRDQEPRCLIIDVADDRRERVRAWVDEILPCGSDAYEYAEVMRMARTFNVDQLQRLIDGAYPVDLISAEQFGAVSFETEELQKASELLRARYCAVYPCAVEPMPEKPEVASVP